jgi:uncharacterized damage-inducible protein DinB
MALHTYPSHSCKMKKSQIDILPEYFDYYINLNEDIELGTAFDRSVEEIDGLNLHLLKAIGLRTYAEGKWTVHKIIQHLTDWERIWCYRTIVAARKEGTVPEGLEQDIMARNSNADELTLEQLLTELRTVRIATKAMFDSFNMDILQTNCRFYTYEMSVLAIGFSIIGHQLHHFKVIDEKYRPLAPALQDN